jgi:hypothetical protein
MVFTTKFTKKNEPSKPTKKKVKKFADGGFVNAGDDDPDPGVLERISRALHGGRNYGKRKLANEYDATQWVHGNEGPRTKGILQGFDAQDISRRVRKNLDEREN